MNKIFVLLTLCITTFMVKAQQTLPAYQPYGQIDKADLEMKTCDFENDANAEILFDVGKIYFESRGGLINIVEERHTRIKIFNDKGKDWANVKIRYLGGTNFEHIADIDAETINLSDNKIQISKLNNKQVYKRVIDKETHEIVFSMPDIGPGSVIEYRYKYISALRFPGWFFQNNIPERYSEINTAIPDIIALSAQIRTKQPLKIHSKITQIDLFGMDRVETEHEQMAMENIPSLHDEPEMTSFIDNYESVRYNQIGIGYGSFSNTWAKVGKLLNDNDDFGSQLNKKLTGEEVIISKARSLKTNDEKIGYIFDTVRNAMKWNGLDNWFTNDGTYKAWQNKSGNSTEINIILNHLLKKSGVKACPMLVSTRENGKVNPAYTSLQQFNRTVVLVPLNIDTTSYLILDASGKYNSYTEIPETLLNSSGLCVDQQNGKFNILPIENGFPIRKVVLINAEISPEAKIKGIADISDYGYNRTKNLELYKTEGEEKYIDRLKNKDNAITISALKLDNMNDDTLPLSQTFNFKADLASTDGGYIYFNPNLFTTLQHNPFISDNRATDIDFGYRDNYSISAIYKIPAGYKADALPKNITTIMPDNSISFKRIVVEQDGSIIVRYIIDHKKTLYFKEDYGDFHEFYKKMYEMLNEQIVLKKS